MSNKSSVFMLTLFRAALYNISGKEQQKQKRENTKMYLSTLFLSEIDNGAEHAIRKCNEEFMNRFDIIRDHISSADSSEKVFQFNSECDEIMALWDVFKDFKDEVFMDLPVIKAMNTVCAARSRRGSD